MLAAPIGGPFDAKNATKSACSVSFITSQPIANHNDQDKFFNMIIWPRQVFFSTYIFNQVLDVTPSQLKIFIIWGDW
jgi:hypothetical protein